MRAGAKLRPSSTNDDEDVLDDTIPGMISDRCISEARSARAQERLDSVN